MVFCNGYWNGSYQKNNGHLEQWTGSNDELMWTKVDELMMGKEKVDEENNSDENEENANDDDFEDLYEDIELEEDDQDDEYDDYSEDD